VWSGEHLGPGRLSEGETIAKPREVLQIPEQQREADRSNDGQASNRRLSLGRE
jgi:hypothetical protein